MFGWIYENFDKIFEWLGVAVAVSSAAVKGAELTKTAKDDNIVAKVVKVLDWLSVFNTPATKEKLAKASKKNK